jgi:hypothetical protein
MRWCFDRIGNGPQKVPLVNTHVFGPFFKESGKYLGSGR